MNFFDGFNSEYSTFILLVAIISFILGLLLGYMIWGARFRSMKKDWQNATAELASLKKEHASLMEKHTVAEAELSKARESIKNLEESNRRLSNEKGQIHSNYIMAKKQLEEAEEQVASLDEESTFFITELGTKLAKAQGKDPSKMLFARALAPEKFGIAADPEDLKKIEGIGPKIEKLLNAEGILTFADLAETKAEKVRKILDAAGPRYKMHDPGSWAKQAKLAADGKWEALKKLQDELDGGR